MIKGPIANVVALTTFCMAIAGPAAGDENGNGQGWQLTIRQLEWQESATPEAYMYDIHAWVGSKRSRLWFRGEGGRHIAGARDDHRLELLWGHELRRWGWMDALELEMLLGIRHDTGTTPSRTYGALGFRGRLPFGVRFEATGYLGDGSRMGDDIHSGVRAQLERGWDLNERLTLVLRAEHEVWSEDHIRYSEGIGPWMWSAGARLHLRLNETIAPYVGFEWYDLVGDTRSLAEAAGEESNEVRGVVGLRMEF